MTVIQMGNVGGGYPMGWLFARTKRLADLLAHPNVLAGAKDLVIALDEWTARRGVEPRDVVDDALFMRGLDHVVHRLSE